MSEQTIQLKSQITGSGEPLVLIPGGLTGWLSWEAHAAELSASRRVVRVQLLNVEYSLNGRELPVHYGVETESRALGAALDAAGLGGPLDLVAWSYGALVTLDFALDHPERVRHADPDRAAGTRAIIASMTILHARVKRGRFVVEEPTELPEGTVVDLAVVGEEDDMSREERAELNASIDRGLEQASRGEGRSAQEVLRRIRSI